MLKHNLKRPCYTIKETGEILSYSRSTVNRLVAMGVLEKFMLGPNSVRITAASIDALLNTAMMGSQMGSQIEKFGQNTATHHSTV